MTDGTHFPNTHLSDEWLSEYIDEVRSRTDDTESHLSSCTACRTRLEHLRSARLLVSAPVAPVSATQRALAVSAAIDAWTSQAATPDDPRPEVPARRHRWFADRRVLGAAAAALVLLAVAVPLALTGRGSSTNEASRSSGTTSHSRSRAPQAAVPSAGQGSTDQPSSAPAPASVPGTLRDLGQVSSPSELVSRLREEPFSASNAPGAQSQGNVANSGSASASNSLGSVAATPASESCVSDTRRVLGVGSYGPGLVGIAEYRGVNAFVMEFWPTSSTPPAGQTVVVAVSESSCRTLVRASL
jgi:hypothetical protein